jgi:hypothetical protein
MSRKTTEIPSQKIEVSIDNRTLESEKGQPDPGDSEPQGRPGEASPARQAAPPSEPTAATRQVTIPPRYSNSPFQPGSSRCINDRSSRPRIPHFW